MLGACSISSRRCFYPQTLPKRLLRHRLPLAVNEDQGSWCSEDTMLCHHAIQPESLKGLGFLGSIYSDEATWKGMAKHAKTIKRDD